MRDIPKFASVRRKPDEMDISSIEKIILLLKEHKTLADKRHETEMLAIDKAIEVYTNEQERRKK